MNFDHIEDMARMERQYDASIANQNLLQYEVILRHETTANRWSLMFQAESFSHAESQAQPYLENGWEIIRIEKDYA